MNRKLLVGAAVAAVVVLGATVILQPGGASSANSSTAKSSQKGVASKALDFSYACANGVPVRATFAPDFQSVRITLPDQAIEMTQAVAASGIRYTGGDYTFWSKGEEAFVMKGEDIVIKDCKKQ
jgi:membrane-bound inhibitor of C-type lysozyme